MKINIEITIDGEKIPPSSFIHHDPEELKILCRDIIKAEVLKTLDNMPVGELQRLISKRNSMEFYKGVVWPKEKPYSDTVPDEKIPPFINLDNHNKEIDELTRFVEEVIPEPPKHVFHETPEPRGVETVFPVKGKEVVEKKKAGRKPDPIISPIPKYLSAEVVDAIRGGNKHFLPGIQAQKNKFVVGGAYIYGRLDEARKEYEKYVDKTPCNNDDILTWESFLAIKFNK
jgi:hypothetical protein